MRKFILITVLLLGITLFGTVGIHTLTDSNWLESAYLAIITLTTVGSRDVPDTQAGMIFVMVYLVSGVGVFTYSVFQLGQLIVNADIRLMLEKRRMDRELSGLKNHYIVCGLGRMGILICEYLTNRKQPFVVIDHNEELLISLCKDRQWFGVHGDATDDEVLTKAGIDRAQSLATVLPTDADNVYVVLSARLLSSSLQIVARAGEASAIQKLQRAGATRVISPFSSGAMKMARFMLNPSIEDFLEITDESGSDLELAEIQIQTDSQYIGKPLAKTDLREQGIMVIGIRRTSGKHIIAPEGTAIIEPGDSLFAFGNANSVNALAEKCV
ncbi:potassium channel protein [Planctomicrobium sp.]|jgi:voltage-gated potassium channel|nr:potassium channel protein [Planctomicrobium sp.]MBT5018402.1 potassium channel protein [Planctomicrobium sp.]MDA7503745.1 potassium channel protein [bacterium]MDB4743172.1 potassium channel protein [Planctomicrobium sp.]